MKTTKQSAPHHVTLTTGNIDTGPHGPRWTTLPDGRTSCYQFAKIGTPGKTVFVDGQECTIIKRDWKEEQSPHQITHNGTQLPPTVTFCYRCLFDIRMPDGTTQRLIVSPPYYPEQAHLNPVAVGMTVPKRMQAGFGGAYTVNAWAQFAERDAADHLFAELIHVKGGHEDGTTANQADASPASQALLKEVHDLARDYSRKYGIPLSLAIPDSADILEAWKRDGIERHMTTTEDDCPLSAKLAEKQLPLVMDELARKSKSMRKAITARRNGDKGGRPPTPGIEAVAEDARRRFKTTPSLKKKRACELALEAAKNSGKPVKAGWQAVQKHAWPKRKRRVKN